MGAQYEMSFCSLKDSDNSFDKFLSLFIDNGWVFKGNQIIDWDYGPDKLIVLEKKINGVFEKLLIEYYSLKAGYNEYVVSFETKGCYQSYITTTGPELPILKDLINTYVVCFEEMDFYCGSMGLEMCTFELDGYCIDSEHKKLSSRELMDLSYLSNECVKTSYYADLDNINKEYTIEHLSKGILLTRKGLNIV